MPSSADVLPEFENLLKAIQTAAFNESEARMTGDGSGWMMPPKGEEWDGNLLDLQGLSKPFSRARANQMYVELLNSSEVTQGDGMVLQLIVDYMAMLERAFRARHTMNKSRAVAHATARRRGHGLPHGVLGRTTLEYLRQIVASGKK